MLRSALAKAAPVVGTVAAVIYTRERKGWAWAVPAGVVAHFVINWITGQVLNAVEGAQLLPSKPVALDGQDVKVPDLTAPTQFHDAETVAGLAIERANVPRASKSVEVIDRNDNIIKLPTAMGEP